MRKAQTARASTRLGLYSADDLKAELRERRKKAKAERKLSGLDQFFTSAETATRLVEWAGLSRGDRVLEPSAGDGAIVRALPLNVIVTAVELDPALCERLRAIKHPALSVVAGDFLAWQRGRSFDSAIMNPPYSATKSADGLHLRHAARLCTRVIGLVRTNALHGMDRYNALWRWVSIQRIAIFARRPDFGGPDDEGHGARHDYLAIDLSQRTEERPRLEPGEVACGSLAADTDVEVELWT